MESSYEQEKNVDKASLTYISRNIMEEASSCSQKSELWTLARQLLHGRGMSHILLHCEVSVTKYARQFLDL